MPPHRPRLFAAAVVSAAVATVVLVGQGTAVTATDRGTPDLTSALAGSQVGATPARAVPAQRDHERLLASRTRGATALRDLGSRLPAVARRNGMTPARLTSVLRDDDTAWISSEGDLYYVEPALDTPTTAEASTPAPAYPTSQTFLLHSKPGAARTIFLDVDGATVSNTGWNTSRGGAIADGTYTGFDLDGSPSTFSTAEHGYVQEVWRQVSATYAAFDVDVTTQDPGAAAISRSSSGDTTYGTHVVITSDSRPRAAQCGGCLGVAYVGTFDNIDPQGYYQPAWVFAYSTSFDPMIIAQAASHETGHTLGLSHDGTQTQSYYAGSSSWGPIMGSAMNRAVSQFSRGEYAGANNTEDDLAVIQQTGLPLRADDHPDSRATAEQLGVHSSYAVGGIIGTRADNDVFALTLPCTTTLTAAARGGGPQTPLDLSLTVLDATGATVASSAPASSWSGSPPVSSGMDASVSIASASGTYYLVVDGTGNGNALNGGWSDYASIGRYTLSASGCAGQPASDPTSTPLTPTSDPPSTTDPTPTPTPTAGTARHAPGVPRVALPISGRRGGMRTAVARWYSPLSAGSAPLRHYRVIALRYDYRGHYRGSYRTGLLRPTAHYVAMALPLGHYRFRVQAFNVYGASSWSGYSRMASSR